MKIKCKKCRIKTLVLIHVATEEQQDEMSFYMYIHYGGSICIKSSIFELRLMSRIEKKGKKCTYTQNLNAMTYRQHQ